MFINLITGGNGGGATAGVTSLNDQKGDLKLKTINSNDLLGEGNIEIQAGVTSVNGQSGEVVIDVPTKVSQLENDANFQTKEQVTVSINEAMSGATSAGMEIVDINNLPYSAHTEFVNYLIEHTDSSTKKYTGTKWPFSSVEGSACGGIYISSSEVVFYFFHLNYSTVTIQRYLAQKRNDFYIYKYGNSLNVTITSDVSICIIGKDKKLDLSDTGKVSLKGYAFTSAVAESTQLFLMVKKSDSESCMIPLSGYSKYYSNGSPYFSGCSFEFEGYRYTYRIEITSTSENESSWNFTQISKIPLGNINSSEVSNIKVLTQSEYDAIDPKDEKTLYMIKG